MANKITTPGYLIKRLRESGFIVIRLWQKYSQSDPRRWTIMIDPGGANLLLTCYENYQGYSNIMFEFNDGGNLWPKNFMLITNSVEVLVLQLIEHNIPTYSKDSIFFKERIKEVYGIERR